MEICPYVLRIVHPLKTPITLTAKPFHGNLLKQRVGSQRGNHVHKVDIFGANCDFDLSSPFEINATEFLVESGACIPTLLQFRDSLVAKYDLSSLERYFGLQK